MQPVHTVEDHLPLSPLPGLDPVTRLQIILFSTGFSTFICISVMNRTTQLYDPSSNVTDVQNTTSSAGYEEIDSTTWSFIDIPTDSSIFLSENS